MTTISYHPGEDAVFIHLHDRPSVCTQEVRANVMVDYDADGVIVAYDIQDAQDNIDEISRILDGLQGPVTFVVHGTHADNVDAMMHHLQNGKASRLGI